jgi:hypothetical protein
LLLHELDAIGRGVNCLDHISDILDYLASPVPFSARLQFASNVLAALRFGLPVPDFVGHDREPFACLAS